MGFKITEARLRRDNKEHPLATLGLVTMGELKECDDWLRQHQAELQKEERRKTFKRLKQDEFGDVDGPRVVEMLLGAISELVVGPVTDYLDTNERATLFAYVEKHKPDSVYLL